MRLSPIMRQAKDRIAVLAGLMVVAGSVIWAFALRGRHIYCSANPRCPQPTDVSLISLRIAIIVAGVMVGGTIMLIIRSIKSPRS